MRNLLKHIDKESKKAKVGRSKEVQERIDVVSSFLKRDIKGKGKLSQKMSKLINKERNN